jgi:dTDP-4-dehydrorhamnose 3,5-epimerase
MTEIKSFIQGVEIIKKNQIVDDRGIILHMLRVDDKNYKKFGEIYFSTVNPNKIKAWHFHKLMTLNYAVVHGSIKLVLYDDRDESKTKGTIQEIILSNENHYLVSIPPKIWNGFCSSNNKHAILANCSDIPHDKEEIIRLPFDDPKFPYKWEI